MAGYMILIVMLIYYYTAFQLFISGQLGLSLAFFAYGLANIGLYMVSIGK